MSDKKEKRENRLAEAVAEIAHSQMGYFIGMAIFMFVVSVATKWDGHLFDRKGCIEIQEKNGQLFKVDTCSGDIEQIYIKDINQSSNKP
jgi:hypothetical protein